MLTFKLRRRLSLLPILESGCKLWDGSVDKDGYPTGQVHRRILSQKLGRPIKKGYMCLHKCDNPSCVEEDHLWEGTHQDNMDDMKRKGRTVTGLRNNLTGKNRKGSSHPRTKLTEQDAIRIRELYSTGRYTQTEIGNRYGIAQTSVSQIISGRNWSHV